MPRKSKTRPIMGTPIPVRAGQKVRRVPGTQDLSVIGSPTPGEWFLDEHADHIDIVSEKGMLVCRVESHHTRRHADARLILRALAMRDAIGDFIDSVSDSTPGGGDDEGCLILTVEEPLVYSALASIIEGI